MTDQKQNAFVLYVRTLAYTLLALALRLAALAPLCFLWAFDGRLSVLAALCPLLWVFVILPLRWSFAQAITRKPRCFRFGDAFNLSRYGEKLGQGLLHALHVLVWGIPMAALLAGAVYCYTEVDALTLFNTINDLGNRCAQVLGLSTANNFMLGVGAVGSAGALGVLIWAWGVVRNSATRYLWAALEQPRRAQLRRCLRGGRLRQLGVGLINLVLLLPFLYMATCALKTAVSDGSTMLMMAIASGTLPEISLTQLATPLAVAFAALYLPLLPLRRWNTAAFALRRVHAVTDEKVSA